MGYMLAYGECVNCRRMFSFNPDRVPSVRVNGSREPVCLGCVEAANPERAKRLWEEAFALDEHGTMESTMAVLGRSVWAWTDLTVREARALRRAVYPTILEGRGL